MAKIRVVLNRAGVRSLLKSQEMADICLTHAEAVAARCGAGYKTQSYVGVNRVNAAVVYPATDAAIKDNMDNNTILKAMK